MTVPLSKIVETIRSKDNFLLSTHLNPDGDAVGSLLALALILKRLNKKFTILCNDVIPENFAFLNSFNWNVYDALLETDNFDCAIIVDTPCFARTGKCEEVLKKIDELIVIDHHISNNNFGTINWVEANASSSGEQIYDLAKALKVQFSLPFLKLIYTAISTDTGSFSYQNTTSKTHLVIADLIDNGLDIAELNEALYSNQSISKLRLFSALIDSIEFACNGKIAWVVVDDNILEKTKSVMADADGFVGTLRNISGVEIAFFVKIIQKDIKVSFRANGNYDVNAIAGFFGGGGHKKAAGCTISGDVFSVVNSIVKKIEEQII